MARRRREKDEPNTTTEEVAGSRPKLSPMEQDRIRREGERLTEEHLAKEAAPATEPTPEPSNKTEQPSTPAPKRALPSVTADVFARASGRRPEQMAGFLARARSQKLGRRTIPEWEEALQEFMSAPIRC